MKYIDADKLKKSIGNYMEDAHAALNPGDGDADYYKGKIDACKDMQEFITSIQQEQPEVDLEEAARHVYESWMGGTMDDVRRDMAELGKVLNARKEE